MVGSLDTRLLELYERELRYLRNAGRDFASRFPKLANRLELSDEGSGDPHIERLLESFAFLAARIHRRIEDDLAIAPAALIEALYPSLAAPIPAIGIAQFRAGRAAPPPASGARVARGSPLYARGGGDILCRFRTAYDVDIYPVALGAIEEELPGARDLFDRARVDTVLRIELSGNGVALTTVELSRLRVHLNGPRRHAMRLYELLAGDLLTAYVVPAGDTSGARAVPIRVHAVGFGEDEAVLPNPAQTHPAYRLLQEYFVAPEKFLFFDIEGLEARPPGGSVDLLFGLSRPLPGDIDLDAVSAELGCTPVINLFERTGEPIVLDHRETNYKVTPELGADDVYEVHSIRSVEVTAPGDPAPRRVAPFFGQGFAAATAHEGEEPDMFWIAKRDIAAGARPGTDVTVAFVEPDFRPKRPARETATIRLWCTNRDLAEQVNAGTQLEANEEVPASIRLVDRLTTPVPAVQDASTLWRLVNQLSLNHLSLSDRSGRGRHVQTLQEILRLYCPPHRPSSQREIAGIVDIECRTVVRRLGRDVWRGFAEGVQVRVLVDEANFVETSAFLFGAVLRQFLALYVSVNSFVELVLESRQREGVWQQWPPMIGGRDLT